MSKTSLLRDNENVFVANTNKEKFALEYLYDKYSAALYGIILKLVKSEPTANKVLQEVFVRVWNEWPVEGLKHGVFVYLHNKTRDVAMEFRTRQIQVSREVSAAERFPLSVINNLNFS